RADGVLAPVADDPFAERGGPVAGVEDGGIDGGAVGGHGERARTVAEELDDGRGRARVGRIEDPDVGAPDARMSYAPRPRCRPRRSTTRRPRRSAAPRGPAG